MKRCSHCGEGEGVVDLTHIEGGEVKTHHLCAKCAAEKGVQTPAALADTPGRVIQASFETWDYPAAAFDLVVSSLALHYVADLDAVMAGIARTLVPGGRVVFSVEHPIITSCARGWTQPQRQNWVVDDYFVTGPRQTSWLGGEVVRYHRTVEEYVIVLQAAGLTLDSLRESRPERERFTDEAEYTRRLRIPLFLFLAGHTPEKPGHTGER